MFYNDNLIINGEHARIIKKYSVNPTNDSNVDSSLKFSLRDEDDEVIDIKIFSTYVECICIAGLIGVVTNTKRDKSIEQNNTASIFNNMLKENEELILDIYKHIYLKENKDIQINQRIKDIFSTNDTKIRELFDPNTFNAYIRGGLEKIDEYFSKCNLTSDFYNKILDFTDDILEFSK